MKTIATDVDDSVQKMMRMVELQKAKPGYAIDPYFYRSHVVYQKELSELIFRSWIYAGHVSEIPNAGDYLLFEIGEDSFIITRDAEGEVHALMNICRHRGARVCENATGNCKTFVCPYHGWVYNLDGSLRAAREMDVLAGFDDAVLGLKRARVEVFMGMIYINCDLGAADFRAPLENIRQPLGAYDLEHAKIAHKETFRVEANWKLCLENYLECYHCATSHRAYARLHTFKDPYEKVSHIVEAMLARAEEITGVEGVVTPHRKIFADAEGFGCCVSHDRYGLYEPHQTGSEDGNAVAPLMGHMRGYDGGAGDFQMGPVTSMLNYPDHCVLYRFIPLGLTSTDMQIVWFVNGDAVEGVDYDKEKLTWLWRHTTAEDEYIISRNSAGVNSQFFEPGPLHPGFESTLMSFYDWYLEALT
ncbi:MAG: aromatic ring-hydroxylating dioxygenase subunit alpha [Proteobacteria bacterium]|nr:aromatic ring-hydroxylating dioxygenase subunit alpha [Pseudomonadota bacterium]